MGNHPNDKVTPSSSSSFHQTTHKFVSWVHFQKYAKKIGPLPPSSFRAVSHFCNGWPWGGLLYVREVMWQIGGRWTGGDICRQTQTDQLPVSSTQTKGSQLPLSQIHVIHKSNTNTNTNTDNSAGQRKYKANRFVLKSLSIFITFFRAYNFLLPEIIVGRSSLPEIF